MGYTTLPDVTISTNFGTIKKIVWFEIVYSSSAYATFNVNLFITANQNKDIKVTIFNNGSDIVVYQKLIPKSANNTTITDSVKITHMPATMSNVYGIKLE